MPRRQLLAGFVILVLLLGAFGQSAVSSSRSYELYSWKVKRHWYYSLLPRGEGKTYQEITGSPSVRRDSAGLEAALRNLPKGTEVFWMSDLPGEAVKPPPQSSFDVKHPSRKRIKHIRSICQKLGISLKLA